MKTPHYSHAGTAGRPHRRRRVLLIAGVVVPLALTACSRSVAATGGSGSSSGSASSTIAKFNKMQGADREPALIAAAKKEGTLTIYTCSSDTAADVVPAFEKKYGIKVNVTDVPSDVQLQQRLLQEQAAGGIRADLVESLGNDMSQLADNGDFAAYDSPARTAMPATAKQPTWTWTYESWEMVAWNDHLVSAGQQPKTLADLASPQWKKQLMLANGDTAWYAAVYSYYHKQGMSDAAFSTMMKAIAANSGNMTGHSSATTLMEGGDFKVFLQNEQFDVLQGKQKNAPIGYQPIVGPVVNIPAGAGILKNAQDPAAAMLFLDYYLTQGQKVLAGVYRMPANPDAAGSVSWRLDKSPLAVTAPMQALSKPSVLDAWATAYNNLLQGSGDVLPANAASEIY